MSRGTWPRWDARRTVESVLDLDVRVLHREGLRPGCRSVITWSGGWGKAAVGVEFFDKDSVLIS
jgi:hypothetical protein